MKIIFGILLLIKSIGVPSIYIKLKKYLLSILVVYHFWRSNMCKTRQLVMYFVTHKPISFVTLIRLVNVILLNRERSYCIIILVSLLMVLGKFRSILIFWKGDFGKPVMCVYQNRMILDGRRRNQNFWLFLQRSWLNDL